MTGGNADAAAGGMTGGAEPPGPLRGLLSTAIDAIRTRLDLIVVEAEIYLLRTLQTVLWAFAAVACALITFVFLIVALITILWDTHRMAGVLGGAGAFALLCAIFTAMALRALRFRPLILEKTLEQLEHDRRKVDGTE